MRGRNTDWHFVIAAISLGVGIVVGALLEHALW